MGRALILNTASKADTTGGTFADTLTPNSGDSLSVANYDAPADQSGAKVTEMWGIDSDSVAEIAVTLTRPGGGDRRPCAPRLRLPGPFRERAPPRQVGGQIFDKEVYPTGRPARA